MSERNLCWSDTLSDQLVKIIICTSHSPVPSPTPSLTSSPSRGQDLHDHTART